MSNTIELPFANEAILPTIPIILMHEDFSVVANALLDTGSAVNLLPYDLGVRLGANWHAQTIRSPLAGNLANTEARGLFVNIQIGHLEPVRLAFAWAETSQVPLILGQTNFFREFDVCSQRSRCTIEITRIN